MSSNHKRTNDAFWSSVEYWKVPDEWQKELYSYCILGYQPGGFHTAVFANDLMMAAVKSHVLNDWRAVSQTCKWIMNVAPHQCWGSYENVEAWLKLSSATRKKICENAGLLYTEKEVIWNILKDPI